MCVRKDADKYDIADLTVPWRSICFLIVPNWFCRTEAANDDISIVLCSCGIPPRNSSAIPEFLRNVHHIYQLPDCLVAVALEMPLEALRLPLANDIQEITFLGGFLMCNDDAVCGIRIRLKISVSVWSDLSKYRERESVMMFSVPLMCCDYRYVLLLTSVHALCIQPSALELSMNDKMCDPCPICRMIMYMVTADARCSKRFNVSFPYQTVLILHRHDRPLLL